MRRSKYQKGQASHKSDLKLQRQHKTMSTCQHVVFTRTLSELKTRLVEHLTKGAPSHRFMRCCRMWALYQQSCDPFTAFRIGMHIVFAGLRVYMLARKCHKYCIYLTSHQMCPEAILLHAQTIKNERKMRSWHLWLGWEAVPLECLTNCSRVLQ